MSPQIFMSCAAMVFVRIKPRFALIGYTTGFFVISLRRGLKQSSNITRAIVICSGFVSSLPDINLGGYSSDNFMVGGGISAGALIHIWAGLSGGVAKNYGSI